MFTHMHLYKKIVFANSKCIPPHNFASYCNTCPRLIITVSCAYGTQSAQKYKLPARTLRKTDSSAQQQANIAILNALCHRNRDCNLLQTALTGTFTYNPAAFFSIARNLGLFISADSLHRRKLQFSAQNSYQLSQFFSQPGVLDQYMVYTAFDNLKFAFVVLLCSCVHEDVGLLHNHSFITNIMNRSINSNEVGKIPDVFGMGTVSQVLAKKLPSAAQLMDLLHNVPVSSPLYALHRRQLVESSTPLPLVPTAALTAALHATPEHCEFLKYGYYWFLTFRYVTMLFLKKIPYDN